MTDRPFRDLCPEADARDAMDDGEFWGHVLTSLLDTSTYDPGYWEPALGPLAEPCGECGAVGACAWDSEGRPLIHPEDDHDD